MIKNRDILPLFSFFESLIRHDFDLGMDEYYILIKSLQGGFGLASKSGLLFLCKKLWLKSTDREELFEKLFNDEFEKEKKLVLQYRDNEESGVPGEDKKKKREEKQKIDETPPEDQSHDDFDKTKPESETEVVEDDQIKLSIENVKTDHAKEYSKGVKKSISTNKFILKGSYLTINENYLKHAWRSFRRIEGEGNTDQLDIDATIKRIIRQGFLFEPVFMPSRVNKASLITLIDHDGSMAAFDQLADSIAGTSTGGGTVSNRVYYFYNIPSDRLFKNKAHTRAEKKEALLNDVEKREIPVLIISDAGAARGRFSNERTDLTVKFLEELKQRTHRIAWINPMPRQRWAGTSAHYIKNFVPMFEATESGLRNVVKLLSGKLQTDIFLKS